MASGNKKIDGFCGRDLDFVIMDEPLKRGGSVRIREWLYLANLYFYFRGGNLLWKGVRGEPLATDPFRYMWE